MADSKNTVYHWYETQYHSHSLKLALYGVNLGVFARFIGVFDHLFRFSYEVYEKTVSN